MCVRQTWTWYYALLDSRSDSKAQAIASTCEARSRITVPQRHPFLLSVYVRQALALMDVDNEEMEDSDNGN